MEDRQGKGGGSRGGGGTEGGGKGRGDRRDLEGRGVGGGGGVPICVLSNHQLRSTLMVPGPGAHTGDAPLAPARSGARSESKSVGLRFAFFRCRNFLTKRNAVCPQRDCTASESGAIVEMNASRVGGSWFPLRRRSFGPSAEEGCAGTTCRDDA